MPIEFTQEFMDHAGWEEINTTTQNNQQERNEKRLGLLKAEYSDLQAKVVKDKSLAGDIDKQERNMSGYGGIPDFHGLDINLKDVNYDKISSEVVDNPINMSAISVEIPTTSKEPTEEEIKKAKENKYGGVHLRVKYPESEVAKGLEHGQYVERILEDNPELAPVLATLGVAAIPLYSIAKTTETGRELVKTSSMPASKPSLEQIKGGYEGIARWGSLKLSSELLSFMGVEKKE